MISSTNWTVRFVLLLALMFSACSRRGQSEADADPKKREGPPPVSGEANGVLDSRGAVTHVHGWAWDPMQPDLSVSVDVYEEDRLLGSVLAIQPRTGLKKVTHDNGKHGFTFPFPASLRDGKAHIISVKIAAANIELKESPQTLTYRVTGKAGKPPSAKGTVPHDKQQLGKKSAAESPANKQNALVSGQARGELVAQDKVADIRGWAWDPTQPNLAIRVDLYQDARLVSTAVADKPAPESVKEMKNNGKHGFVFPFPPELRDGKSHEFSVKISGANIELKNSPRSLSYLPEERKEAPGKNHK